MNIFAEILLNFCYQMFYTVGIVVIFGLFISFINKAFYRLTKGSGNAICYITGVIGTPIHESSHALMCLLFGHKIKDFKLFQLSDDGVLGYVRHSYNKKNIYQKAGNFFIGIAPVVIGSIVLFLLSYLFVPDLFKDVSEIISAGDSLDFKKFFSSSFTASFKCIAIFFQSFKKPLWWIYLAIGISIALHMNLSSSDIKSGKLGGALVLIIFFIIDLIIGLISRKLLAAMTGAFVPVSYFLLSCLMLSVLFSLGYLIVGLIIFGIKKTVLK